MSSQQSHPELSPEDRRLLDALVEVGYDPHALEGLSDAQRQRAEALAGLVSLLDDYPVADADESLVHATMARIDRLEESRTGRLRLTADPDARAPARRGWRIRVPDFVSVAAVLLIAASVLWPISSNIHRWSIDQACSNNLRIMGYAFGNYAADYSGAMPIAQAGLMYPAWNQQARNVVNLGPLVRGGYCDQDHLECAGHDDVFGTSDSYSYQWQEPDVRHIWGQGRLTVVLGDRNPIIDAFRAGERAAALSISLNHGGRGQNVLTNDGATLWLEKPITPGGDNIWLPDGLSYLAEGVHPADASDSFLTH